MNKWTPEQLRGITTTGKSLLVSAAAGSGKTAVLAERCAHLVCDATPCCDVDELLVVTFTDAAATEMRGRIQQALRQRLAKSNSDRLTKEVALVEHAQISTLHGFCATLLRQHFHLLDLDPNFTVLDGDEAELLRAEVARELLADRFEKDSSGEFQSFIDAYADGDDERIVRQVVRSHEMLCSLIAPRRWLADAKKRIAAACELPLTESDLGRELMRLIESRLADVARRCDDAVAGLTRMNFMPYLSIVRDMQSLLKHLRALLASDGIDALASESQIQWPKLPPVKAGTANKEVAQALVEPVRGELKDGPLRELLSFTSQQWLDGLRAMRPHAEMFLELLEQFATRYRSEKQAARVVDFSDLERLALQALREKGGAPSAVAKLQHQRFKHVLVDEYQDINEVQDEILRLVSCECLADGTPTNLFCVGDVKQSIYRFRLADPMLFLGRQENFKRNPSRGVVIDLQKNFRSRGPLLEAINSLFHRLMTRAAVEIEYDRSQELIAGADYSPAKCCFTGAPIELHVLPEKIDVPASDDEAEIEPERAEREALLIARRIRAMIDAKTQVMEKDAEGKLRPRNLRFGNIVLLLRSMRFKCDQYAEILRQSGIPVHSESATGFFESMEVRDILSLLKVLDNQQQDIPLAAVLRSPLAAMPEAEDNLARIRMAYRADVPFHQAVVRYAAEKKDELAARLSDFLDEIKNWREMAHRRPLAEVIWSIYDETGYLAFCEGLIDGEQRKANLIDLHERARQFGTFQRQGLQRFLRFLESLESESDLGQPSIAGEGENVVRIMSVHRSKGLEFPVVILPDLGKRINLSDCSGSILLDRSAYLGMSVVDETLRVRYPSLASVLVRERLLRQSLAEELRVLYVAMTRAREHLILVGTCKPDAVEQWTNLWAGHNSPLPADVVLGARKMIDWIGPVAIGNAGFEITSHSVEEVASWPGPEELRPPKNERLEMLARLAPLDLPGLRDEQADAIIAQLTAAYPFEKLTKLKAVYSATEFAKRDGVAIFGQGETLAAPKSVSTQMTADPAEVGTATHLVLEHVDFSRPCDVNDLRTQIDEMIAKRLISPDASNVVDIDSICWLIGSEIGALLLKHLKTLRRELAITFALPPEKVEVGLAVSAPADWVMVRGRIDVLIETPAGLEIVDYKTDRVTHETIEARREFYAKQMTMYERAIHDITHKRVTAIHLVFLSAREIRSVALPAAV